MDFSDKKSLPQGNLSCVYSMHHKIHKSWPWNYEPPSGLSAMLMLCHGCDIFWVKLLCILCHYTVPSHLSFSNKYEDSYIRQMFNLLTSVEAFTFEWQCLSSSVKLKLITKVGGDSPWLTRIQHRMSHDRFRLWKILLCWLAAALDIYWLWHVDTGIIVWLSQCTTALAYHTTFCHEG